MRSILARYRYSAILLRELVRTDFKLRYQGSVLGYLWSLLRPLFLFVILYVVFALFLFAKTTQAIPHYPVYLLLGLVLWNYFVEVTTGSIGSIVSKGELLRKINFPKYVIVFAGSCSALINLAINFVVIAIFMAINQVDLSWRAVLLVPLVIELFVLSLGMAFFLSALFVKFRDVSYIWDVVMQAGFYATPIFYGLSQVPHRFAKYLVLNPLAQIIQDARYVLVTQQTATINQVYGGNRLMWLIPLCLALASVTIGAAYFRSQSKKFAEEV